MKKIKLKRLYLGLVDIKSDVLRKCTDEGMSIQIEVEGRLGNMILKPEEFINKIVKTSKLFKSQYKNQPDYRLISYKWEKSVDGV